MIQADHASKFTGLSFIYHPLPNFEFSLRNIDFENVGYGILWNCEILSEYGHGVMAKETPLVDVSIIL